MADLVNGIVTPNEWLSRTSLVLRRRSKTLQQVDKAYENYYRIRSEENGLILHGWLQKYLFEKTADEGKSRNRSKLSRNNASGGLMEYIYNSTGPRRGKNILEMRAPEARHGVLYLWQNASVETQWIRISLEGALSVGGDTVSMLQSSSYQSGDRLQSLGVIGNSSSLNKLGTEFTVGQDLNQGAQLLGYGPKGRAAEIKLPEERQSDAIYASRIREDPGTIQKAKQILSELSFQKVWTLIKEAVAKIWEDTRLKWYSGQMWGNIGTGVVAVSNFILGKVVANAAPFASNAIAVAQGLAQALKAGADRVAAWNQRGKFIIMPGHPAAIANSITTQMNWDIASGLYNAVKGGVLLAGEALTAGASALINLVAACLEFAYKLFTRGRFGAASDGPRAKRSRWISPARLIARYRQ